MPWLSWGALPFPLVADAEGTLGSLGISLPGGCWLPVPGSGTPPLEAGAALPPLLSLEHAANT